MSALILDFPTLPISKCFFDVVFNSELSISKTSGVEHVVENPGERWVIQYHFKILTLAEAKLLKQHLNKLRGPINKTRLYDPRFNSQDGTWSGSPVIDGANQYGLYVDARGFGANQTVAKALDRCVIDDQLMELSDDAVSDGTGRARLHFTNELRKLTTDGMGIISNPSALRTTARWAKPEQIKQLSGNKRLYRNATFDFIEAFT